MLFASPGILFEASGRAPRGGFESTHRRLFSGLSTLVSQEVANQ